MFFRTSGTVEIATKNPASLETAGFMLLADDMGLEPTKNTDFSMG